jgi:VCBS repeat protein
MRVPLGLKLGAIFVATTGFAGVDRPDLPRWNSAPWEFVDGSGEITQVAASRFRAATAADFDNDGDKDVVVVAAQSAAGIDGTPAAGTLFMNEGGRFVDRTSTYLPLLANSQVRWWSVAADFTGPAGPPDGFVDLFVAGGQGEASRLFMNLGRDGGGNFLGFQDQSARLVNSPITGVTHSYTARTADFNGDGQTDLIVFQYKPPLGTCTVQYAATCYGQTRLLINSNGTLVDETATRLPARNEPSLFGQVGDFNGDGHPDIAMVNLKNGLVGGSEFPGVPSIRVLMNDGAGNFKTNEQIMPERSNPGSGFGTYSLDVGDFNKDGRQDIFVINWGLGGAEERDGVLLNIGSGNQLFPGGPSGIAYPIGNEVEDDDGDHPSAVDLDGDGDSDLVVAQFAARPYFLINESRGGPMTLVERTPPVPIVPNAIGFRNMVFDANGDGVQDVWLALRDRNFLTLGALPEREPNSSVAAADTVSTIPSVRTGLLHVGDEDVFALPAGAVTGGTRVRLRPAANGDLRLRTLDAAGNVLTTSQNAGNGVAETIDVAAGGSARFARVERQGAGGGPYRLEILRPGTPLAPLVDDEGVLPRDVGASARKRLTGKR